MECATDGRVRIPQTSILAPKKKAQSRMVLSDPRCGLNGKHSTLGSVHGCSRDRKDNLFKMHTRRRSTTSQPGQPKLRRS